MRCRRAMMIVIFPAVFYITSVFVKESPKSQATAPMTFKWKSRIKLQGQHGLKSTLPIKMSQQEEEVRIRLLEKAETGIKEGASRERAPGSEGLLRTWRRNQLRIIQELQNFIKQEAKSDDPSLLALVKRSLVPPSDGPLKTSHGVRMTSLSDTVDRLLGTTVTGFFLEASAQDGEGSSHTLWLEKVRGWTGVLVEPDPAYFLQILGKNRRAWSVNAALSPSRRPSLVVLDDGERQLGAVGIVSSGGRRTLVPAYPIGSLLLALNRTHVDFLYLELAGDEWAILHTIPWDDVSISVIGMEVSRSPIEPARFIELLTRRGYRCDNKPQVLNQKYTSMENHVICNKEGQDTYIYQDNPADFD